MNEAKALRHVELLARITVTFEAPASATEIMQYDGAHWVDLADVLRDLRLALVELDLARSRDVEVILKPTPNGA